VKAASYGEERVNMNAFGGGPDAANFGVPVEKGLI
jgi:hypothetical protein